MHFSSTLLESQLNYPLIWWRRPCIVGQVYCVHEPKLMCFGVDNVDGWSDIKQAATVNLWFSPFPPFFLVHYTLHYTVYITLYIHIPPAWATLWLYKCLLLSFLSKQISLTSLHGLPVMHWDSKSVSFTLDRVCFLYSTGDMFLIQYRSRVHKTKYSINMLMPLHAALNLRPCCILCQDIIRRIKSNNPMQGTANDVKILLLFILTLGVSWRASHECWFVLCPTTSLPSLVSFTWLETT